MTEEEKQAAAAAASSAQVQEVDFDNLDALLGLSDSVVTTAETPKTVLSDSKPDLSFMDDDLDGEKLKDAPDDVVKAVTDQILDEDLNDDQEEDGTQVNKGGRPKLVKDAMVEAANRLIEKGVLAPFDDGKALADYTVDDFEELIQANIESKITTVAQEAPIELFKTLPEDVQAVVKYALDGGQDTKAVFNQLAKVHETFELDVEKEEDQESIIRQWYNALGTYDTIEELEDEINLIKDRGDLKKYAERYKPKLDAKQADIVQEKLKEQQQAKVRKEKAREQYSNTVIKTLQSANLNGIPLNEKVQNMLYYGLTDSSRYQTAEGKPTNALGFLLEQHQFGANPNFSLVAEALWLLADPQNYKDSIKKTVEKATNEKTARLLRTEQGANRNASSSQIEQNDKPASATRKAPIQRTGKSIFSR
jgi:hypothetical protein